MNRLAHTRWFTRRLVALVLALAGTAFFFLNSDLLARAFQSVARLEVDPLFSGGRVCAVLFDPVGDDHGFGELSYPTHPEFLPQSLDLVRYTVHEPVYGGKGLSLREYWQLEFAFAGGSHDARNIRMYLDADGDGKGQTIPRDEFAEGIQFDPSFPWDYVLSVHGTEAVFESPDGSLSVPVCVYLSDNERTVIVRIPLVDRRLHRLYVAGITRQYVLIGGWSPWGRDGFLPVRARPAIGTGGGAVSALCPAVFDFLSGDSRSQEAVLSAWNDERLEIPVLLPVDVDMKGSGASDSARDISGLREAARREAEAERSYKMDAYEKERAARTSERELEYAISAFRAGYLAEAETACTHVLSLHPDNPVALAYMGSIVAKKASDAPVLAAVELVSRAYQSLDRAVMLASTGDEILAARLNRANVSLAVPETVFAKALTGASDFLAAVGEYGRLSAGEKAYVLERAHACLGAARCFAAAGKAGESGTWYREAARLTFTLPAGTEGLAGVELALAEQGLFRD